MNLRPGTYSVTFSLPGFSTVKREGIELSGTFVATVNGDLKVGALEETITVTGETPIVDVQSAKTQTTVGKDIIAAIPTSHNVNGIQALIPGMNQSTDSGNITGTLQGGAAAIHGGRGNDFLLGESGADRLSGGPGNDSIDALDGRRDTIACGPGVDAVLADARDVIGIDCDRVRIGRR